MKALLTLLFVLVLATVARATDPVESSDMPAPDLSKVFIATKARPLTNCRVVKVTQLGVTFICDQGLIQVPFKDLPAELRAFYIGKADKPIAPPMAVAPKAPTPPAAQSVPAPKVAPKKELTPEQKANQIASLKQVIQSCEAVIDTYSRQMTIGNPDAITSAQYEAAKRKLEEARGKLAALEG